MEFDTEISSSQKLEENKIIDGLIGRNILKYFDFRYNGKTGIVTLIYLKDI